VYNVTVVNINGRRSGVKATAAVLKEKLTETNPTLLLCFGGDKRTHQTAHTRYKQKTGDSREVRKQQRKKRGTRGEERGEKRYDKSDRNSTRRRAYRSRSTLAALGRWK
jgi:hypothetical protein